MWPFFRRYRPGGRAALAQRTGAEARRVLTSRNAGLPVRRVLATRWPDVMKSGGGGANAILVRGGSVVEHRRRRLCRWPERRWVHAVAVRGGCFGNGAWVGNLHATAHDTPAAERDSRRAAEAVLTWAALMPCVLGGDFNLRRLALDGLAHVTGHDVDHVFARGCPAAGEHRVLERGQLSDHAPVLATLARVG